MTICLNDGNPNLVLLDFRGQLDSAIAWLLGCGRGSARIQNLIFHFKVYLSTPVSKTLLEVL